MSSHNEAVEDRIALMRIRQTYELYTSLHAPRVEDLLSDLGAILDSTSPRKDHS